MFFFLSLSIKIHNAKLITTYTDGFKALPSTVGSCVTASDDLGTVNSQGCAFCQPNLLLAVNQCILKSNDGLITAVCSQKENGNALAVTSCYTGIFSTGSTNMPTAQPCAKSSQYCQVNKWRKNFISYNIYWKVSRLYNK